MKYQVTFQNQKIFKTFNIEVDDNEKIIQLHPRLIPKIEENLYSDVDLKNYKIILVNRGRHIKDEDILLQKVHVGELFMRVLLIPIDKNKFPHLY